METSAISDANKEIESEFMTKYWNLRKMIATPEERQDYWKEVIDSLRMLAEEEKFRGNSYIENVLLACLNDIEEHSPIHSRVRKEGSASLALFNYFRKKRNLPPVEVKT